MIANTINGVVVAITDDCIFTVKNPRYCEFKQLAANNGGTWEHDRKLHINGKTFVFSEYAPKYLTTIEIPGDNIYAYLCSWLVATTNKSLLNPFL